MVDQFFFTPNLGTKGIVLYKMICFMSTPGIKKFNFW